MNHYFMYMLVAYMAFSGVNMGYQSGYGVPLFGFYTLPGCKDKNDVMADYAFHFHKCTGSVL